MARRQGGAILDRTFSDVPGQGMFTKAILYGMNLLSLASFLLMGVGLTLNRQGKVKTPVAFALMGAGTVLVFLGLYVATPP